MEIKCGMIVKSVAGHDKDRFYLIVKIQGNKIYISEEKEPRFEKFKNLKDDKDRIEQKMKSKGEKEEKIKEYLEKFEEIAKNLEKIFKDKKTRNNKNK